MIMEGPEPSYAVTVRGQIAARKLKEADVVFLPLPGDGETALAAMRRTEMLARMVRKPATSRS